MSYKITPLFKGFPAMLGLGTFALLQNEDHNILFDTGNGYIRPQMARIFQEVGLTFDQIDTVILSHLHWDHTFNSDFFPKAKYMLSAVEWEYANRINPKDIIIDSAALARLRNCDVRLIQQDGEEILPGIYAMFTPGHTPGSMSAVVMQDNGEKWILTGDAVKTRGELITGYGGMTYDPDITRASIERVRNTADRVLLGHDGWIRICNGEIFPETTELVLNFSEGVTVNGGLKQVVIRLDDKVDCK